LRNSLDRVFDEKELVDIKDNLLNLIPENMQETVEWKLAEYTSKIQNYTVDAIKNCMVKDLMGWSSQV
jgi:hypothetical protein